jgi:transcriptional regulator with XRE-family HTH domain
MAADIITSGEIGAAIRKRRKELGLSQEQLAEKVGVSYQQIQRYENGGSMLNVENIQRIAKALNVAVAALFETTQTQTVAEPPLTYASSDERLLLRHFRGLSTTSDKQLAIALIRKIAKK